MAGDKFVFEDLRNMCRLCHSRSSLVNIFDSRLESENMAEVVEVTTGVKVSPNDDVSHMLCSKCSHVTIRMFKFRFTSMKNDLKLLAKAEKQKALHKSVNQLFQIYPKLIVPSTITNLNLSPRVYMKRDDTIFLKKIDGERMKKTSKSNKKCQRTVRTAVLSPDISEELISIKDSKQSLQAETCLRQEEENDQKLKEDNPQKEMKKKNLNQERNREENEILQQKLEEDVNQNHVEKWQDIENLKQGKQKRHKEHEKENKKLAADRDEKKNDQQEGGIAERRKELSLIHDENKKQKTFDKENDQQIILELVEDEDRFEKEIADQQVEMKEQDKIDATRNEEDKIQEKSSEEVTKNHEIGDEEIQEQRSNKTYDEEVKGREEEDSLIVKPKENSLLLKRNIKKTHICGVCNNVFYSPRGLKKHEKNHKRCPLCGDVFASMKVTKEHQKMCSIRKIMNNLPVVEVERCDKVKKIRENYGSAFEFLTIVENADSKECDEQKSEVPPSNNSDIEKMEVEIVNKPARPMKRRNSSWRPNGIGVKLSKTSEIQHVTAETSIESENRVSVVPVDSNKKHLNSSVKKNHEETIPQQSLKNATKGPTTSSSEQLISLGSDKRASSQSNTSTNPLEVGSVEGENLKRKRNDVVLSNYAKKTKASSTEKSSPVTTDVLLSSSFKPNLKLIDEDVIIKDENEEEASYLKKLFEHFANDKSGRDESRCNKDVQTELSFDKVVVRSKKHDSIFILKKLRNHLVHYNIPVNISVNQATSIRYTNTNDNTLSNIRNYRKWPKTTPQHKSDKSKTEMVDQNITTRNDENNITNIEESSVESRKDTIKTNTLSSQKLDSVRMESNKDLTKKNMSSKKIIENQTYSDCKKLKIVKTPIPIKINKKNLGLMKQSKAATTVGKGMPQQNNTTCIGISDTTQSITNTTGNVPTSALSSNSNVIIPANTSSSLNVNIMPKVCSTVSTNCSTYSVITGNMSNQQNFNNQLPKVCSTVSPVGSNYPFMTGNMNNLQNFNNQKVYMIDSRSPTFKLLQQDPSYIKHPITTLNSVLNANVSNFSFRPQTSTNCLIPQSLPGQQNLASLPNINTTLSQTVFAYPKMPPKRQAKDCMKDMRVKNNSTNCSTKDSNCDNTKSQEIGGSPTGPVSSEGPKYVRVKSLAELM